MQHLLKIAGRILSKSEPQCHCYQEIETLQLWSLNYAESKALRVDRKWLQYDLIEVGIFHYILLHER